MKRTVQFTRYYYKTVEQEIDVPDDLTREEQEEWILENANVDPDLYADKSLETEDDAIYILED